MNRPYLCMKIVLYRSKSYVTRSEPLGYSPLNMHEHSPRLFRVEYSLYIRDKLTSAVNHHDLYIGFCCVYYKDEFMSVKIKHALVGNPVTG